MKKTYDITLDCDGWSCRSAGQLLGSFPSWLLAIGAMRAAAEADQRNGITPTVRYQDLKGTMHTLDLDTDNNQHPHHHDPKILKNIDRLAYGERHH